MLFSTTRLSSTPTIVVDLLVDVLKKVISQMKCLSVSDLRSSEEHFDIETIFKNIFIKFKFIIKEKSARH